MSGCKFFGVDLRRHLGTHVRKHELGEEDVQRMVKIMSLGKKQRGPKKLAQPTGKVQAGRRKKWCLVPGCNAATLYVGKHLQSKVHGIKKSSARYQLLLKKAKPYTGTSEMDVLLNKGRAEESSSGEDKEQSVCEEEGEGVGSPTPSDDIGSHVSPTVEEDDKEEGNDEREGDDEGEEDGEEDEEEEEDGKEDEEEESSDDRKEEESSDDDDDINPKVQEYFEAKKYENYRHQWLCGFFDYLSLPVAGYKKLQTRLQHASQVKILLEHIAPKIHRHLVPQ